MTWNTNPANDYATGDDDTSPTEDEIYDDWLAFEKRWDGEYTSVYNHKRGEWQIFKLNEEGFVPTDDYYNPFDTVETGWELQDWTPKV